MAASSLQATSDTLMHGSYVRDISAAFSATYNACCVGPSRLINDEARFSNLLFLRWVQRILVPHECSEQLICSRLGNRITPFLVLSSSLSFIHLKPSTIPVQEYFLYLTRADSKDCFLTIFCRAAVQNNLSYCILPSFAFFK